MRGTGSNIKQWSFLLDEDEGDAPPPSGDFDEAVETSEDEDFNSDGDAQSLHVERLKSEVKLSHTLRRIIQKYEDPELSRDADVVDLFAGEIVEDHGHLRSLRGAVTDLWRGDDDDEDEEYVSQDRKKLIKGTDVETITIDSSPSPNPSSPNRVHMEGNTTGMNYIDSDSLIPSRLPSPRRIDGSHSKTSPTRLNDDSLIPSRKSPARMDPGLIPTRTSPARLNVNLPRTGPKFIDMDSLIPVKTSPIRRTGLNHISSSTNSSPVKTRLERVSNPIVRASLKRATSSSSTGSDDSSTSSGQRRLKRVLSNPLNEVDGITNWLLSMEGSDEEGLLNGKGKLDVELHKEKAPEEVSHKTLCGKGNGKCSRPFCFTCS